MTDRPLFVALGAHVLDVHAKYVESIPEGQGGALIEEIRPPSGSWRIRRCSRRRASRVRYGPPMPVPEAKLVDKSGGLTPEGPGWFIMNVADAVSFKHPLAGQYIRFEDLDNAQFQHYGIGIHVLWPGQPNAMYHAESNQESFMVLEGECRLIVEGEERIMRKWDFFHCPPMTRHITVGAGDGPCAILMVGARLPDEELEYPHDPLAARYGAQSPVPTSDPKVAYSELEGEWEPGPFPWPLARGESGPGAS